MPARLMIFLRLLALRNGLGQSSDMLVREQYRVLCRQIPTMYVLLLANSSFLAFVVASSAGWKVAFGLPALVIGAIIVRLMVWMRRRGGSAPVSTPQLRRNLRGTVGFGGIFALGLSVWTLTLLHLTEPSDRLFIPLFTALSSITCGYCLISLPLAAYQVIILGTLPIAAGLIMSGNMVLAAAGANLIVVATLIVRMVATQYRQFNRIVSSRNEILDEKAKVNRLAHCDDLTGLPNRRAFLRELALCGKAAPGAGFAVVMIDLDGFKPINDTYGHATGDELLVETARRLSTMLPAQALVARLGGDEFAVLLRGIDDAAIAETMTKSISKSFSTPFQVGPQSFRVSASFGFAHGLAPLLQAEQLLTHADIALYEAKKRIGVRLSRFTPPMEAAVRRRMMIEQSLSVPDQYERITLDFQPLFRARALDILGFEALARWVHPELGEIAPSEFVTVAEQCGMTDKLTRHLFDTALTTAEQWPDAYRLCFNLSAAELGSPRSAGIMTALMAEHGFNPKRLAVEVTETALLNDFAAAREALAALRALGVQVWLDDFGAGYASIGYLREMEFDAIKLDGGLVGAVLDSEPARNLLIGVLHLCQAINAPVIAEMVETSDHLALLRTLPIAMFQGFHLARPMPGSASIRIAREESAGIALRPGGEAGVPPFTASRG